MKLYLRNTEYSKVDTHDEHQILKYSFVIILYAYLDDILIITLISRLIGVRYTVIIFNGNVMFMNHNVDKSWLTFNPDYYNRDLCIFGEMGP